MKARFHTHEDRILEYFAFGNLGIMISKAIRMLRALDLARVAWFRNFIADEN